MATSFETKEPSETAGNRCDIKVWSPDCQQSKFNDDSEKYLCSSCKTIPSLNHEMRHDQFPYICGDDDLLS